ncbi:MAG TPA: hypothetical protein VE087_07080 [Xanthobacteraceae bacterium]|nr:hypothetical protein [Xanthobacteraceae bacterium]
MESVLRLILRLFLVPLGGVVAVTIAMILLVVAHWHEFAALADARPDEQGYWLLAFVLAGPVLAFLLSLAVALTLLAAAVGVLISEAFAIRSWIYHAANGGLAAWIGWSLMQDTQNDYRFLAEPKIMVAAGLAGGLAYWVVAGSTAGFWKPVFRSRPQQA